MGHRRVSKRDTVPQNGTHVPRGTSRRVSKQDTVPQNGTHVPRGTSRCVSKRDTASQTGTKACAKMGRSVCQNGTPSPKTGPGVCQNGTPSPKMGHLFHVEQPGVPQNETRRLKPGRRRASKRDSEPQNETRRLKPGRRRLKPRRRRVPNRDTRARSMPGLKSHARAGAEGAGPDPGEARGTARPAKPAGIGTVTATPLPLIFGPASTPSRPTLRTPFSLFVYFFFLALELLAAKCSTRNMRPVLLFGLKVILDLSTCFVV
jgi:hypothetical protein